MQTIPEANKYFEEKTKEIGKNLKDLEGVLQGKSNNLRMVEDGMFSPERTFVRSMLMALQCCGKKSCRARILMADLAKAVQELHRWAPNVPDRLCYIFVTR